MDSHVFLGGEWGVAFLLGKYGLPFVCVCVCMCVCVYLYIYGAFVDPFNKMLTIYRQVVASLSRKYILSFVTLGLYGVESQKVIVSSSQIF